MRSQTDRDSIDSHCTQQRGCAQVGHRIATARPPRGHGGRQQDAGDGDSKPGEVMASYLASAPKCTNL